MNITFVYVIWSVRACMYVCVHIYMSACMYVYIYVCDFVRACVYAVYMHVFICTSLHTYMSACMYARMYVILCVSVCANSSFACLHVWGGYD